MPVVEVLSFPCSEDFIKDRAAVLGPALEGMLQVPGYLRYTVVPSAYAPKAMLIPKYRANHALQLREDDQEIGYVAASN